MTSVPYGPAFGPARLSPAARTELTHDARHRIGDIGIWPSGRQAPGAAREPVPGRDVVRVTEGRTVTRLEVSHRAGIWQVTKDGRFYGHYFADQPAFAAAEAAAFAVVASGGAADVLWDDARPHPTTDPGVAPTGVARTRKFRTGSAPIVR